MNNVSSLNNFWNFFSGFFAKFDELDVHIDKENNIATILFNTEEELANNTETMSYFFDILELSEDDEDNNFIHKFEGSYAEIQIERHLCDLHASGNGDFRSHKIELIPFLAKLQDKPIQRIAVEFERPDGSLARIVTTANDHYVHTRKNEQEKYGNLCSKTPHPNIKKMSRQEYLDYGKSEELKAVTIQEILKVASLIGKPLSYLDLESSFSSFKTNGSIKTIKPIIVGNALINSL